MFTLMIQTLRLLAWKADEMNDCHELTLAYRHLLGRTMVNGQVVSFSLLMARPYKQ
jgi:hypothetical protein